MTTPYKTRNTILKKYSFYWYFFGVLLSLLGSRVIPKVKFENRKMDQKDCPHV